MPDLPAVRDTIQASGATSGTACTHRDVAEDRQEAERRFNEVLRQPDIVEHLKKLNVDFKANTPDEFRGFVAEETAKWGNVVREAGIKIG